MVRGTNEDVSGNFDLKKHAPELISWQSHVLGGRVIYDFVDLAVLSGKKDELYDELNKPDGGKFVLCPEHDSHTDGCYICERAKLGNIGEDEDDLKHYLFRTHSHEDDSQLPCGAKVAYPYAIGPKDLRSIAAMSGGVLSFQGSMRLSKTT